MMVFIDGMDTEFLTWADQTAKQRRARQESRDKKPTKPGRHSE